jgi:uncharacterized UBP type Zn finger protein
MAKSATCEHLNTIKVTGSRENKCKDCVKLGDTWEHLRLCLQCGYVGCCDSSKNKHATKHFHESGHPIIKSQEKGERWKWCFIDELSWV